MCPTWEPAIAALGKGNSSADESCERVRMMLMVTMCVVAKSHVILPLTLFRSLRLHLVLNH